MHTVVSYKSEIFLLKDTFLLAAILPPALLSFEGGIKAGSYHFNETFSF